MSIILTYTGNIQNFKEACREANEILSSNEFIEMIASRKEPYDDSEPSDLSPRKIAEFFQKSNLQLTLKHYSRPQSIGGAFDPDYPTTLWVNVNTNRKGCTYAAVLIHECVHALSYHTPNYDFTHKTNGQNGNEDSAPYAIQTATRNNFCNQAFSIGQDLIEVETKVKKEDIVD